MPDKTQYRLVLRGPLATLEKADKIFYELGDCDTITATDLGEGEGETWQLSVYYGVPFSIEGVLSRLSDFMPIGQLEASYEEIPDVDWVAKVQSDLKPVCAGRYLIHGSHDRARAAGENFAIEIDAGAAFGTAHHGTTLGCLEVIDQLLKSYHPAHVLDLGTGTGVLAIAVAMRTRKIVLATDIDPVCIEVTRKNSKINGATNLLKVCQANGFASPVFNTAPKFDLVIANILAGPLMKMAGDIGHRTQQSGHLILSGILQTQSRHVIATYRNHGFVLLRQVVKDVEREGWTTLHMHKL